MSAYPAPAPCLLCGGRATVGTNGLGSYSVVCGGCHARTRPHSSPAAAVAAWGDDLQRQTAPTTLADALAELAAVRRALRAYDDSDLASLAAATMARLDAAEAMLDEGKLASADGPR